MKSYSVSRVLAVALSLPYFCDAVDCAGSHTVRSKDDITELQGCKSFSGQVILDSSLRQDIDLSDIQWTSNASITTRDCGNECPQYEYSYGENTGNYDLFCDATALHDIKLHGMPIREIYLPYLETVHDLVVTSLPLRKLTADKLHTANTMRFIDNQWLHELYVAPGFSAGTPESHLPEAGLEIRNSRISGGILTNIFESQRPCGDIYIDSIQLTKFDFALRASGDVVLSCRKGGIHGAVMRFMDRNITEYAAYNNTYSRSITVHNFRSINMYKTETATVRQHRVGTFNMTNIGDDIGEGSAPVYFKDVNNLIIQDSKLSSLMIIPSLWKNYHLESMIMKDVDIGVGTRLPGLTMPDDDETQDLSPFYWPQSDIERLEYHSYVETSFFDSFTRPEDFTNSSMWERANRPKIKHMVVQGDERSFRCKNLKKLTKDPVVIEHLDCREGKRSGAALLSTPRLSRVLLSAAVAFLCML